MSSLEKRIFRQVGRAIQEFRLTEDGDKILVAVSGGKDSWVMLHVLNEMKQRAPVRYELLAVNIDQGWSGFRQDTVEDYLTKNKIPYHMEDFNAAQIIQDKAPGDTPCSLCARLRRGVLYGLAEKFGCNKIALGHHMDDLIETLLLNAFFVGRIGAMSPRLRSDDGKNTVIRPLAYVTEADIIEYSQQIGFPIVCCQCPLACGENVHDDFKRKKIKNLLKDLEKDIPHIKNSLITSLTNVHVSHLLDRKLWDFK